MKVFFIGTTPITQRGISPDSMEAHILSALDTIGVKTSYFAFTSGGLGRTINRLLEAAAIDFKVISTTPIEKALLKSVADFQPDLILVLLGNYTPPATIHKIRNITKSPIACWCQDHMGTMGRQYILGSKFDYIFAKDQVMVDLFRRYTSVPHVHYLAEACNPAIHTPIQPTSDDLQRFGCEVTTAATLYYYRSEIFESLTDFDLRIWGPVPRFYDGPLRPYCTGISVYTRDKSACFNASKIVVNSLFPMEFGGLNARTFEVAGCGGFQIITDSDVVAKHFEIGKEIETFRDLNELRTKIRYYLDHDNERQMIANAGRVRAHSEHTYEHRLKTLLDTVNKT